MTLSILIWLPLVVALIASQLRGKLVAWTAVLGSLVAVGIAVSFLARFKSGGGGLQFVTDRVWVWSPGIHYKLGLDGLDLALILIATVLFSVPCCGRRRGNGNGLGSSTSSSGWPRAPYSAPSAPRTLPCSSPSSI